VIIGAVRSMLHDQSLPIYLWEEMSATVVYLQNMSPQNILVKMTPKETFTGRRPDVENIRIFGCLTYSHVPSEKRTKLDPTTQQGILVEYLEVSKSYQIYIPSLRRVVVSRDVIFEEGRDFQISLESRVSVEDDAEEQINVSEGAQLHVYGMPVSGVKGSPCTNLGSQSQGVQAEGVEAL
jgi:hypothetical protein